MEPSSSSSDVCNITPNGPANSDGKVILLPKAPDGGYGWVVCFAAFVLNVIIDGIRCSFGVLLNLISEEYQMEKSTVSFIGSVHFAMTFALAPFTCGLAHQYGCRAVGMGGGVILGLGLFLTYFTKGFWHLFASYGILAGTGECCLYAAAMLAPNYYFEKKRAFATAFCNCGSAVGIMAFPPLIHYLCTVLGWQETLGIFSLWGLVAVASSFLMKPLAVDVEGIGDKTSDIEMDHAESTNQSFQKEMQIYNKNSREEPNMLTVCNLNSRRSSLITLYDGTPNVNKKPEREEKEAPCSEKEPFGVQCIKFEVPERSALILKPMDTRRHSVILRPMAKADIFYDRSTMDLVQNENISTLHYSNHALDVLDEMPPVDLTQRSLECERSTSSVWRRKSGIALPALDVECTGINSSSPIQPAFEWKDAHQGSIGCLAPVKSILMEMLDFKCLKNKIFCLILVSFFVANLAHQTSFIFLPSIMIHDASISPQRASFVISVIGISGMFGRLSGGIIANFKFVTPTFLTALSFLGSGVIVFAYEFCRTEVAYICMGVLYGFFSGPYNSIQAVLLIDLFGLEKLTSTFGILTLIRAVSNAIGPPLLSCLFKMTHHYSTELYASCCCFIIAALICGMVCFFVKGFKVCYRETKN